MLSGQNIYEFMVKNVSAHAITNGENKIYKMLFSLENSEMCNVFFLSNKNVEISVSQTSTIGNCMWIKSIENVSNWHCTNVQNFAC